MSTPGDPVHERVVGLAEQREARAVRPRGQALHEPQLPERLVAVERLGEHAARQRAQLVVVAGRRQRRAADVVAEVQVRVVDPLRASLPVRHEGELLAVARDQVQAPLGGLHQLVVIRGIAGEEHHPGDVHVGAVVLQVEERRVQSGQAVAGHLSGGLLYASRRERPRAGDALVREQPGRGGGRRAVRRPHAHGRERPRRPHLHGRGAARVHGLGRLARRLLPDARAGRLPGGQRPRAGRGRRHGRPPGAVLPREPARGRRGRGAPLARQRSEGHQAPPARRAVHARPPRRRRAVRDRGGARGADPRPRRAGESPRSASTCSAMRSATPART